MSASPKDNYLFVDEIFTTIQGESLESGYPCTFLRLFGCDIGCSFCDQHQDIENRKKMSIGKVISKVEQKGIQRICITGGEPLMQWNALYPVVLELVGDNYQVAIETSGCYPIDLDEYKRSFKYVMDIKCPSSGVSHKNIYTNLMHLRSNDEVKFVIGNREDYQFALKVMRDYPSSATITFSPCFDENNHPLVAKELTDWMMKDKIHDVKIQIQLHKILGVK